MISPSILKTITSTHPINYAIIRGDIDQHTDRYSNSSFQSSIRCHCPRLQLTNYWYETQEVIRSGAIFGRRIILRKG